MLEIEGGTKNVRLSHGGGMIAGWAVAPSFSFGQARQSEIANMVAASVSRDESAA
jgi:hypothetical protein